jgi:hypothetical protein
MTGRANSELSFEETAVDQEFQARKRLEILS